MHTLAQAWKSKDKLWKWKANSSHWTWQQTPLAAVPSRWLLCFSFLWKVSAVLSLATKIYGTFSYTCQIILYDLVTRSTS